MGKAEIIERDRSQIAELKQKYALAFQSPDGESPIKLAADMKLSRSVLSPPKTVVPCAAELKDTGRVDPCLVVPSSLPIELLP